MPWFIYHYPLPRNQSSSYTVVPNNGVPECEGGKYLGAILVNALPNTIPLQPDLNVKGLQGDILAAMRLKINTKTIKLRPTP